MNQCITYEVSFERQISMGIDVFDKHNVKMFNLSEFFLRSSNLTRKEMFICLWEISKTLSWWLSTKIMVGGYVDIHYELFIGLNI